MQSFYELSKRIYDMTNPREVRRALIFCVRAYFRRAQMRELDLFFRRDSVLAELADIYPFVYEQPTRAFFYNKSTFDERVHIVESHMLFLREHIQKRVFLSLYRRESLPLWSGIPCMGEQMTASSFCDWGRPPCIRSSFGLPLPRMEHMPCGSVQCRDRIWRMRAMS